LRRLAALGILLAAIAAAAQDNSYEASPGLMLPKGLVLFYNNRAPLSYATLTPRDVPADAVQLGEVRGKSCQYGVAVPLTASLTATSVSGASGDGGYWKAIEKITQAHPDITGIYDVKVDVHLISFLGFIQRTCVEVLGRGFRWSPPNPSSPQ